MTNKYVKRSINKQKWKKLKKNYRKARQTMVLDPIEDSVYVVQVYKKREVVEDKGQV